MELKNTPEFTMKTIKRMEDFSSFAFAQIFDDLLIVAQKETNCFVWKTSEGLVVIDGIWPDERVYNAIVDAIESVGWNKNDISKFVVTHGHTDHTGCGKWLVKNYNVKTYLSKTDDEFWQSNPTKPNRPETWKDFDIDVYVKDGDEIKCGDKSLCVYETPGHTPGCLSYIFPVYDNGVQHIAALIGGETPPWNSKEGAKGFIESIKYFGAKAKEKCVDVALCNHTAFDNGNERIAYASKRFDYMPNPYIIGTDGFDKFCDMFVKLGEEKLK